MALPKTPITRRERFLAGIANGGKLPEPVTREERYLAYIAKYGAHGGSDSPGGETDDDVITPDDAKEIFDNADPTPNGNSSGDVISPDEAKEIFDNAEPNKDVDDLDGNVDDEF